MREAGSRDSPDPVNLLVLDGTIFTSEGHGNLLSYFPDILVFLVVQKVLGVGTIPDLHTLEDFHVDRLLSLPRNKSLLTTHIVLWTLTAILLYISLTHTHTYHRTTTNIKNLTDILLKKNSNHFKFFNTRTNKTRVV